MSSRIAISAASAPDPNPPNPLVPHALRDRVPERLRRAREHTRRDRVREREAQGRERDRETGPQAGAEDALERRGERLGAAPPRRGSERDQRHQQREPTAEQCHRRELRPVPGRVEARRRRRRHRLRDERRHDRRATDQPARDTIQHAVPDRADDRPDAVSDRAERGGAGDADGVDEAHRARAADRVRDARQRAADHRDPDAARPVRRGGVRRGSRLHRRAPGLDAGGRRRGAGARRVRRAEQERDGDRGGEGAGAHHPAGAA